MKKTMRVSPIGYQTLVIETPGFIAIEQGRLKLTKSGELDRFYPLIDVQVIIIHQQGLTMSVALINEILERGIVIYFVNDQHTVVGQTQSLVTHGETIDRWRKQMTWELGRKAMLWQQIIRLKITHQAMVLKQVHGDINESLERLKETVLLNDEKNVEAQAAKQYFQELFGRAFKRFNKDLVNANLNYGYAILHGMMQQAIIGYGYFPQVGIHHQSGRNPSNLVYDFLEPFRPIVDRCLFAFDFHHVIDKAYLKKLHEIPIRYGKVVGSLSTVIPIYVQDCLNMLEQSENKHLNEFIF
jgi:CRISPR-associated protein Cas1